MTIFKPTFLSPLASVALGVATCLCADVVKLENGDILTGTINALSDDSVSMTSPFSTSALEIQSDQVRNISFSKDNKVQANHSETLTLSNGDTLPCKIISLDSEKLKITTWYAGDFDIPRAHVKALQFGIADEKVIYQAKEAPEQWPEHQGSWKLAEDGYQASGQGTLARELDLPQNIRFQFDISWQQSPNFAFLFCADDATTAIRQSTYEFTFNSAGFQIRRYLKNRKTNPLVSGDLDLSKYDEKKIHVDIRVNRDLGIISLYLDQQKIGSWNDTLDSAEGNYIVLNNRSSKNAHYAINNLQVSHWRGGEAPRFRDRANQGKSDLIIDSQGEKITGSITAIQATKGDKRAITFAQKYQDPIQIQEHRISSLIFAANDTEPVATESNFSASLAGGGTLQLANPQISEGKLTSSHPILGSCTIDTSIISRIEKTKINP